MRLALSSISALMIAGAALAPITPVLASDFQSAAAAPARVAAVKSIIHSGALTIETVDITPRFLDFQAQAAGLDPDARWAAFKNLYDFSAVPPTPEGAAIARRLLDQAWPRYPAAMPAIDAGLEGLQPEPVPIIQSVASLLELERPAKLRLTAFVGAFENNAFTSLGTDGVPTLFLPVEADRYFLTLVIHHEAAHAIHAQIAGFPSGYERSVARMILEEGIATRVTQQLLPGKPDETYLDHVPGWWASTKEQRTTMLRNILPFLEDRSGATLFRFTMGKGATGFEREAYAVGWLVAGALLEDGMTIAELARVSEERMPNLVRGTIERLLQREAEGE